MKILIKYIIFFACIAFSNIVMAQVYVSGFVKDSVTGERLIFNVATLSPQEIGQIPHIKREAGHA